MAKEYVPIFFDWLDTTQDLSAEEKGNLIDAVVAYASGGEYEHLLVGGTKIAFRFLKGQVDRNNAISDKRSAAASNKDEQNETNANKTEQNQTNENKQEQNATKSPKEKDKDKEKDKENKKIFIAPTLDEVTSYMREIGCDVDPQYFLDYQTARNWVLSNGKKAQDWKAVVRTWKHNNFSKRPSTSNGVKKVIAQMYTQRDYEGEQEELVARCLENVKKSQSEDEEAFARMLEGMA